MRAHVLQHVPFEGPGTIGPWLESRGATVTTTRFFESPALLDCRKLDFVVAMGGPMSVNDEAHLPWLRQEKQFLRDAIARGVPVLGVCLGAQLIASSLGMRVYPNGEKEIGWFPITAEGSGPFDNGLRTFHWHGETFDLPPGAALIASTPACRNQAFQIGRHVLALQFHLEITRAGVQDMVTHCRGDMTPGRYVQSEAELLAEPAESYAAANVAMTSILTMLLG